MRQLCIDGKAALIIPFGVVKRDNTLPQCYLVPNVPAPIPTAYLSYPDEKTLSQLERAFFRIAHQYFSSKHRLVADSD